MKRILLLVISFFALNAFAGDTLTVAQVYYFSVGDTFDYRHYTFSRYELNPPTQSTTYERYVVARIYYSTDSSIKYIQRRQISSPSGLDTIVISNLSSFESLSDTGGGSTYPGSYSFNSFSTTEYHGRTINSSLLQCNNDPDLAYDELVCADGIGIINRTFGGGGSMTGPSHLDSTILVYYSKGTETWGTPYYDFPNGIQSLTANVGSVVLSPANNNGTFNLKINDASLLPLNLAFYDITGREIKRLTLSNLNNNISIQPMAAGTYIWTALQQGKLLQTGKLVVY